MTTIWNYLVDLIAIAGLTPEMLKPLLIWGGLSLALNLLQGRRTQIEAWCKLHPRVSGFLQVLRGLGIDPVKISDGLTALVTGNWQKANKGKLGAIAAFLAKLSAGGLVLLALSCSGSPPQLPQVCPIPSQYLAALPTPAAVASSVQAAQGVVEQVQVVAEDPSGGAAILLAAKALDTIEPLCDSLTAVAKVDCAVEVGKARAVLAKSDTTRQQICSAVKLAVIVAQVAEDTVPLVALDEVCK